MSNIITTIDEAVNPNFLNDFFFDYPDSGFVANAQTIPISFACID